MIRIIFVFLRRVWNITTSKRQALQSCKYICELGCTCRVTNLVARFSEQWHIKSLASQRQNVNLKSSQRELTEMGSAASLGSQWVDQS
eukprot:scaffold467923_cov45-Prasinocladus_malaysianus.AAC.1